MPAKTIDLGYRPRQWQHKCHEEIRRFTVLALHRRAGKTELAIMQLIDRALKCKQERGLFVYLAPFLKQAKIIAWHRLKDRLGPLVDLGTVVINEGELFVSFKHNGAQIRIFGGDNPDGMRGIRLDGIVIDEVAQIKVEVWQDIIQPALSDRLGWALFIGTPHGINLFSELYYRSVMLPDWHSESFTCYDTDALDKDEIERLKRDMSPQSFAREMLCDFSAAGDDQLISVRQIEEASRRIYKLKEFDYAPRIMGIDPARFGDDASVIIKRQGLQIYDPIAYHGIDNMELAAQVAYHIRDWKPDYVFCDIGNGAGVIDRLRQLGHTVIEVNFGSKPLEEEYANKRSEMWWNVRKWLQDGGAIPNHQRLKQDLAAPTYWYDTRNKIVLEPKDDIKARGLPSTDFGDAAALCFSMPVGKPNESALAAGDHKTFYNPLAKDYIRKDFRADPYNPLSRNAARGR